MSLATQVAAGFTRVATEIKTVRSEMARTRVTRTPEQYGAAGDGVTDDQSAFSAMFAAMTPNSDVVLKNSYLHSNVLPIPVTGVRWYQEGELLASNRQAASIQIGPAAKGIKMYQPRHKVAPWNLTGNSRGGTDILTAPFAIYDTEDVEIYDAFSQHSAQCGFYLATVHGYHIERPIVDRSYADGFHQTHNCEDGYVTDPLITRPGDDGLAIVSYLIKDGGNIDPNRRIHIVRPTVKFCHARGLSIVGGSDILYSDIDVFHTRAAGAMIASESGYNTHPATRCVMEGGSVRHFGYPVAPNEVASEDSALDHGALFLLTQQASAPLVDSGFRDIEVSDMGAVGFQYFRAVSNNGATFTRCFYERCIVSTGFEGRGSVSMQGSSAGITYDSNVDNRSVLGQPRLSADVTNTTINTTNTGLGFSNVQPGTYEVEVNGYYSTAATSTGIQFNWGFSGSQSLFVCSFDVTTGAASYKRGITTATNATFSAGTASAGTTILPFTVRATIVVTAPVVLDFKYSSTVAGSAATVKAGTLARLTRIA